MTEGFGGVWVSNLHDDTVTRVDPETFEVVAQIPVGKEPKELVAALGSVWVVNSKSNTVTRIDPETNRVVRRADPGRPEPDRHRRDQGRRLGDQLRRRHRQRASSPEPWTPPASSTTPRCPPAPSRSRRPPAAADPGFLPYATVAEWDAVLAATETLRFHPGDVVLRAGERDRAFYLLLDGRLEAEGGDEVVAPAAIGVAAFLDGAPRAVTLPRAHARRAGAHELGRLRGARGPRPAARAARSCATSAAASPPACAPPARRLPGWTG